MTTGTELSVMRMCGVAGFSRAGYYRFLDLAKPARVDIELRDEMQKIALEWRLTFRRAAFPSLPVPRWRGILPIAMASLCIERRPKGWYGACSLLACDECAESVVTTNLRFTTHSRLSSLISRCTRLRLTFQPRSLNSFVIRRLP